MRRSRDTIAPLPLLRKSDETHILAKENRRVVIAFGVAGLFGSMGNFLIADATMNTLKSGEHDCIQSDGKIPAVGVVECWDDLKNSEADQMFTLGGLSITIALAASVDAARHKNRFS